MGEHSRTGRGENTPEKNKNYRKNKPEEGHQGGKMKKKRMLMMSQKKTYQKQGHATEFPPPDHDDRTYLDKTARKCGERVRGREHDIAGNVASVCENLRHLKHTTQRGSRA